jgi:hypothetical protein
MAVDWRGRIAVAAYEVPASGVAVPELGLVAPLVAAPVRRGEERVRPGTPCLAAAPIAIAGAPGGVIEGALAAARMADAETALGRALSALAGGQLARDLGVLSVWRNS